MNIIEIMDGISETELKLKILKEKHPENKKLIDEYEDHLTGLLIDCDLKDHEFVEKELYF